VGIGFTARCETRTNDTNTVHATIRVSDKLQTLLSRHPDRDEPAFVYRVIWIIERFGERIQEDGLRFVE
jgi:hypothetical protein